MFLLVPLIQPYVPLPYLTDPSVASTVEYCLVGEIDGGIRVADFIPSHPGNSWIYSIFLLRVTWVGIVCLDGVVWIDSIQNIWFRRLVVTLMKESPVLVFLIGVWSGSY